MARFAWFLVVAALAFGPAQAAGTCKFVQTRELKVIMDGLQPSVSATVNGKDARFIVDTGSFYSLLTRAAADRLGVKQAPHDTFELSGVDGRVSARNGRATSLVLAGREYKDVWFVLSAIDLDRPYDGLIGQNILAFGDAEYDFANGVVRSFTAEDCASQLLAYWVQPTQSYGAIDIEPLRPMIARRTRIAGRVLVNGEPVRAVFDTGSATSMLTADTAHRLGYDLKAADVTGAGWNNGIAGGSIAAKSIVVRSFQIDQEVIRNTRLRVADIDIDADMLIGADFFLAHRVLVARSQDKLYFTYNGGPVFRFDHSSASSAPAPSADKAPPADVDGLERRAFASLARKNSGAAIRDFDAAIALDPKRPQLYFGRARARAQAKQFPLAVEDIDRVVQLAPADIEALIYRGKLQLDLGRRSEADRSFDAAMAASSDAADLRWRIVGIYEAAHEFAPALAMIDAWIASHPKDAAVPVALNRRCWVRALWGRELDRALADCNAALGAGLRAGGVLDSRGLVYLRSGDPHRAIRDYDAALYYAPDLAWSHLGRGLARLQIGDAKGAAADFAEAERLQEGIRKEAEGFGLSTAAGAASR